MNQSLSVCIITFNEEANLARTLASVADLVKQTAGEIIVVDSGSTDRTVEIAKSYGAKVFVEPWKGYATQKNSAIEKATADWILLLDADEELDTEIQTELGEVLIAARISDIPRMNTTADIEAYWIARKNFFLGRWVKHGGFYPDRKLRLFRRGAGKVEDRAVHETIKVDGRTARLRGNLIHYAYPTLQSYIGHINKYSTLGAEMAVREKPRGFSLWNILIRPAATFFYNYFLRLGFLDGKEGLLLHLYHSVYVSWKYAKIWEMSRKARQMEKK